MPITTSICHALQTHVNIGGVASFVGGYKTTYQALVGRPLEMAPDHSSLVTHMLVRLMLRTHQSTNLSTFLGTI